MIEHASTDGTGDGDLSPAGPLDATGVSEWTARLRRRDGSLTDVERIDLIRALEELTCSAAAAQPDTTAALRRGGAVALDAGRLRHVVRATTTQGAYLS